MKPNNRASMSDDEFNAVLALAAEGRPIPAIVMAAILERVEAQAAAEIDPRMEQVQAHPA